MPRGEITSFEKLGGAVQSAWRAKNFRYADFPEIAFRTLVENPIDISYGKLIRWALTSDRLPQQDPASEFGQPPIRLYHAPLFFLEALFWLQGTTSIHQHSFSGAFQVLAGSSIQSTFHFRKKETISSRFLLGDLRLKQVEYLSRGDTRPIYAGSQFIHSLFHLDHPSVTIVIRTYKEAEAGPQYDYHPPFLALDPFAHPALLKRRLQLLDVLQQTSRGSYLQHASKLVADSDLETVYFVLDHCYAHLTQDQFQAVLEKAQQKHGSIVDLFVPVLQEHLRKHRLISHREKVKNPDHRFFLALLLNVRTRQSIQRFIRKRYRGNPDRWIEKWVQELTSAHGPLGGKNLLGMPWDEMTETMMRLMLSGLTFASIVRQLQRIYSIPELSLHKKLELHLLYSALRNSMFKPLFETSSALPGVPKRLKSLR